MCKLLTDCALWHLSSLVWFCYLPTVIYKIRAKWSIMSLTSRFPSDFELHNNQISIRQKIFHHTFYSCYHIRQALYHLYHFTHLLLCIVETGLLLLQGKLTFPSFCGLFSLPRSTWKHFCIYPVVWKLGKSPESHYTPKKFHTMLQDISKVSRLSELEISSNTWFSLNCRFNTEIKVVHLCWNKHLIEDGIINYICSFLS